MEKYFTLIFLLGSFFLKAQDQQLLDSIQLEKEEKLQLYIAPAYSLNQFVETSASFAGIHLGIIYKEKVDLNIYYSAILDNFMKQIIFPQNHEFEQKNLGVKTQYSFLKKSIRPHAGISFQFSEISWIPLDDSNNKFNDNIYLIEPYVGISWMLNRTFTLLIDGGYNIVPEVELVGLESDDFSGFAVNFMVKIRFYQF